jgi:glycine dehydrogenase subunit 1
MASNYNGSLKPARALVKEGKTRLIRRRETFEDLTRYEREVHDAGALFIAAFSEPLAFGILTPGGECGADIVCGEGQSFGLPLGFGGPYLGMLACRERLVRNLPGRIAGRTVDMNGRAAYVLTLTAREQHIRREKATSNICTNQGLCALRAAIYLTALGKCGIRRIASLNARRARRAAESLIGLAGVERPFDGPFFNEFVLRVGKNTDGLIDACVERGVLPGIPLKDAYPELGDSLLVTVTEMNPPEDIDRLSAVMKEALAEEKT